VCMRLTLFLYLRVCTRLCSHFIATAASTPVDMNDRACMNNALSLLTYFAYCIPHCSSAHFFASPLFRYAFYDKARSAFAVVQTAERRPYGCFLLQKVHASRSVSAISVSHHKATFFSFSHLSASCLFFSQGVVGPDGKDLIPVSV